ncbi:MAG TPA: TAXI family TRAP transporter solute-binding subunit [Burkholderiales bacterium]|nr:TAXI family TRAP transporter solute-binding subunit [Burkholderiales bacterium]
MRRTIRDTLLSARDLLVTTGPFILLTLGLLCGAYVLLKPTPPKRVVLATGPDQGAYAAFGKRYAEELKPYGIDVVLRATAGSRENLRLLQDPKEDVQVAFVQGGASETLRTQEEEQQQLPLISLGSMFYEPVWIFYRQDAAKKISREGVINDLSQFRGMRVNIGTRGSGIPGIMGRLLRANLMDKSDIQGASLDLVPSVVALLDGSLDAVAIVSAPESQLVQMLLQTPGIRLYEFAQAEAYARRYSFLSPVTLPRGVVDLSRNVPPRDIVLVAATCSLVAREDLHPALIQLLVQAASRIHSHGGWIARDGQFPMALQSEFPLARDAERYYRTGPPLLQRYLPFWLANLVDRMWVALFSIAVILIPLGRVLPPLYQFRIRSRIFRWYRDLRQIEEDMAGKAANAAKLLEQLEKLDAKAERIAVPLAYTDQLYALRGHIALVRERLRAAR